MIQLAVISFVIALIAGLFGFEFIASTFAGIALVIFFVFLVIFLVTLVMGLMAAKGMSKKF